MTSTDPVLEALSRPESDPSRTQRGGYEASTLTVDAHAPAISDVISRQQEKLPDKEETRAPRDPPYPTPSSLCGTNDYQEMVITAIRVTDIALGLRRLPAGFFIVLHHNDYEWRTHLKPSSVNHDAIEWSGPIPIISPSDMSTTIRLEVYASFEFHPMLGSGERLRRLTATLKLLLERSEKGSPFTFFPKDGDVVSPCSSIFVAVKQRQRENSPAMSNVVGPHWSKSESPGELEEATNRGHSALSRYRKHGEKQDLEYSVRKFEHALGICPLDHPGRAAAQSNLALAKLVLGQIEHKDATLQDALRLYRGALTARPVGHPDRPSTLIQATAVHFARKCRDFAEEGWTKKLLVEALESETIDSHGYLAATLMRRMLDKCNMDHVQPDGQFSVQRRAIPRLMDEGCNLLITATELLQHFVRFGDLADLQEAIKLFMELADGGCMSIRGVVYCMVLGHLGMALTLRFERLGEPSDIQEAVLRLRESVDLIPEGHHKPGLLNNLGNALLARFECIGHLADLEAAITALRDAIDLAPRGHPERLKLLCNLGTSFNKRFLRLGQLSDIEDAISSLKQSISEGIDQRPHLEAFTNLGIALLHRFEHLDQPSDIEDAISWQRYAVDATPPHDHPARPARLNNLAFALATRFDHSGRLGDIDDAISLQKDAVNLTPDCHSEKPPFLSNLGRLLISRFIRLDQPSDLDDAIQRQRDAVEQTPYGHPQRAFRLHNLAISLKTRFQRFHRFADLEEATSRLIHAVDITPQDHYSKARYLGTLGRLFYARFRLLGELRSMELAISLFSHAASSPIGPVYPRFQASRSWISCARHIHHRTLLHAYSTTINLLPHLAWIGLPLQHRCDVLAQGADIVRDAAAAALDAGLPQTAVEWLEQGRSIVWGELIRLRDPHDELSSVHPDHACRLYKLSIELDRGSASYDKLAQAGAGSGNDAFESSPQLADRQRALAIQRDKLLQEIRRLPGFEQFLLPKRFSQLRTSSAQSAGPVVILNAVQDRCDALILVPNLDHAIHVPLPNFTLQRSIHLQGTLKHFVRHAREGKCAPLDSVNWDNILSPLWQSVVKPVLDALAISVPNRDSENLPRIFWCPTGPLAFLPIHAAGLYDRQYAEPGHKVFDFVVSSYVPTVSILSLPSNHGHDDLRLLLVRQPLSDGLGQLPGVAIELSRIKDLVKNSASARTTVLETSDGTVDEVLTLMKKADWVHFACHGVQDGLDSGLCLAQGRRLKLRELTAFSRPRGGLAFLSACQTAQGDQKLSEEAIHMAAGMLFAGYGGVVGTMWSISDRLAPDVTRGVYAALFRRGIRPDYRDAARALHDAIGGLRERGVSFDEWIPFIHVGL